MTPARHPVWDVGAPELNPANPGLYEQGAHFEVWRRARERHPIAWTESSRLGDFWSVTGHAIGNEVLKRPDVFTSIQGMRLGSADSSIAAAAGKMLVVSDGAGHRRLRSAHTPWFRPRGVDGLRASLTDRLESTVDELVALGRFDVVTTLSKVLPMWTLCGMLGIPPQHWEELAELAATAFAGTDTDGRAVTRRRAASARVFAYFDELLAHKAANRGDDLVSFLLAGSQEGRLTRDEVIFNCDGLVNGGLGTTRHAISDAILVFAQHPGEWTRIAADPSLLDSAVDEILRWTCAPLHVMRTATRDVSLGDAQIRAGDRVAVWLPACNRDESVFARPAEFVIDRRPNPHLSFGGGPHFCIGAPVARLELRCLLAVLLDKVEGFEVVGPVRRRSSDLLLGIDELEVTVAPRRAISESAGGARRTRVGQG